MSLIPYAGIGSRKTPAHVLVMMEEIARYLAPDYLLRSGGAPGADSAFQDGVRNARLPGRAQIFLPGRSFNGNQAGWNDCIDATTLPWWKQALATVDKFHPAPWNLKPYARALMARNAMQVLGPDLRSPSRFVIAWTPGAATHGKEAGGTGQALRIALEHNIPILNLGDPGHYENAVKLVYKKQAQRAASQSHVSHPDRG